MQFLEAEMQYNGAGVLGVHALHLIEVRPQQVLIFFQVIFDLLLQHEAGSVVFVIPIEHGGEPPESLRCPDSGKSYPSYLGHRRTL